MRPFTATSSLLLCCLCAACSPQAPETPAAPLVLTHTVGGEANGSHAYTGEIRARHEPELSFRVGGRIVARLVDVGAEVKPGQALARLDPNDLQLAAGAARAQLAAAESDLSVARQDKQRYADLLSKKFVSQAAYDAKENAFNAAEARLRQARASSEMSGNQAAYGTLTVEFPAVVTAVLGEAGQVVAAGQPVLRVARPEEKEVLIAVPEGQLKEIREAGELQVELWADPQQRIAGRLRELAPAADPTTRTYAARIRLLDPPPGLSLGMSARVLVAGKTAGSVAVPLAAVVDQGLGPSVWRVRDGKVASQPVEVERYSSDSVLLRSGVQAGDQLVVAGHTRLSAGMAVRTQAAPAAADRR